jgi:carbon storage regulator
MLVLTRKNGEGLTIDFLGRQVRVVLLKIRAGGVRLGIEAPKEMNIYRDELGDEPCPTAPRAT